MTPHATATSPSSTPNTAMLPAPTRPPFSKSPPRLLIIGAGSRGNAYAEAIAENTNGLCVGIAEPLAYKRELFGRTHIWHDASPTEGQEFTGWKEFLSYELERRERQAKGEKVPQGIDAVFICVQDEMHIQVILGLAPLNLHIMCEKPLATTLSDCISIYQSLQSSHVSMEPTRIFSIGHVLRYSPHNMLLRKLLLEDRVIGDITSINHTEPVGWWHFSHSYVRGNWRREATSAPSLLTKSCHDIDFLLWLLCSPPPNSSKPAHLPALVSSMGSLQYFNQSRKPLEAGDATNCLSCAYEPECKFSAKKIYIKGAPKALATGNREWPVHILVPDIEECIEKKGYAAGEEALLKRLREDYTPSTPRSEIQGKNWYGRCVYESDNDVCDDQSVTISWNPDPLTSPGETRLQALAGRGAKLATFHMVAFTQKVCERYTNIYGTEGEIYTDSSTITVKNFTTGEEKKYFPYIAAGGHGGGDGGLARQFVLAVDRVKNHGEAVREVQKRYVGCDVDEIVRSHAMVFAAEEARRGRVVLDFGRWWGENVGVKLRM